MQERLVRDTCRVCRKQGPQYKEIREDEGWYPAEDTPKDLKHGFCSWECWEAFLTNILGRCERRRTERESRNSGETNRQGIPVLRAVRDDDEEDDGQNPGHRDGRESMKGHHRRQGGGRHGRG